MQRCKKLRVLLPESCKNWKPYTLISITTWWLSVSRVVKKPATNFTVYILKRC